MFSNKMWFINLRFTYLLTPAAVIHH